MYKSLNVRDENSVSKTVEVFRFVLKSYKIHFGAVPDNVGKTASTPAMIGRWVEYAHKLYSDNLTPSFRSEWLITSSPGKAARCFAQATKFSQGLMCKKQRLSFSNTWERYKFASVVKHFLHQIKSQEFLLIRLLLKELSLSIFFCLFRFWCVCVFFVCDKKHKIIIKKRADEEKFRIMLINKPFNLNGFKFTLDYSQP